MAIRFVLGLSAAWLLLCGTVTAQTSKQGAVVVLSFSGPRGDEARSAVERSLSDEGVQIIDVEKVERTVEELRADLQNPQGRQQIAAKHRIRAFVAGRVEAAGRRRFRVRMGVFSGEDGSMVGTAAIGVRRAALTEKLAATAAERLSAGLDKARPPEAEEAEEEPAGGYEFALDEVAPEEAEPEPKQEEEEEERPRRRPQRQRPKADEKEPSAVDEDEEEVPADEEEDDDASSPTDRSPLVLGGGLSFLGRSLAFKEKVGSLSDHKIQPNPSLLFQGRFYPVGLVKGGWMSHIGLEFRYAYMLFASSRKGDQEYETTAHDLRIGLHGRLPLGAHDVGLGIAYGSQSMAFEPADDGSAAGVPEYGYSFLRFAADGRVVIGEFAIEPYFALLLPTAFGEVERNEWFPHMTGLGLEAGALVRWALGGAVELFAGGGYRQWGLTFNPEPDDLRVTLTDDEGNEIGGAAGGATDRYISIDLGVAYRF